MKNRTKHNVITAVIYILLCDILLQIGNLIDGFVLTAISIIVGFFLGMLNDIIIQLRKLNGEKFPNLED